MNEHDDLTEQRMIAGLGPALDVAVRPFDATTIAREAESRGSPSILRITGVAATVAVAAIVTVVTVQQLGLRQLQVGGPGPSASTTAASSSSPADGATRGPVPESAHRPDGSIDLSQVPDFIPALDGEEAVGWISREDAFPLEGDRPDPMPVYGEDLRTTIGHVFANIGFVPLGVDPASVSPDPKPTFWAEDE